MSQQAGIAHPVESFHCAAISCQVVFTAFAVSAHGVAGAISVTIVLAVVTGITLIDDVQCTLAVNTGACTSFLAAKDSTTMGNVNITAVGSTGDCTFYLRVEGE